MEIRRPILILSLQQNVKYVYYEASHQTIKNFWTVFYKLPEEKKKKFLGNILTF